MLQFCLLNTRANEQGKRIVVGFPMVLSIGNWFSLRDLHNFVFQQIKPYLCPEFSSASLDDLPYDLIWLDNTGARCSYCISLSCKGCRIAYSEHSLKWASENITRVTLGLDWKKDAYKLEMELHDSYYHAKSKIDEIEKDIQITDCFNEITRPETLDGTCEKCKAINSEKISTQI